MGGQTRKRPVVAAGLAIVYPGLGHVYLKSWLRALLWFWMAMLAVVLFVPERLFADVGTLSGLTSAIRAMPIEAVVALAMVVTFNVVDAYWQATRFQQRLDGARCPSCGRSLEDNLDLPFCHWCTNPLPGADESS